MAKIKSVTLKDFEDKVELIVYELTTGAISKEDFVEIINQSLKESDERIFKEIDEHKERVILRFKQAGFPEATIKLINQIYDDFKQILIKEHDIKFESEK